MNRTLVASNEGNPTKGCKTFEKFLARNKDELSRDQCEALWAYFRKEEIPRDAHHTTKQPQPKTTDIAQATGVADAPMNRFTAANDTGMDFLQWLGRIVLLILLLLYLWVFVKECG